MKTLSSLVLVVLSIGVTQGVLCPNKKDSCPSSTTCCALLDGTYGCCPYSDAQCCPDKIHCCPSGSTCNVNTQTCDRSVPFKWMVPIYKARFVSKAFGEKTVSEVDSLGAANTQRASCSSCDMTSSSCCSNPEGEVGCCPFVNGKCCPGGNTCCPGDRYCGGSGKCLKEMKSFQRFFYDAEPKEIPAFNLHSGTFEESEFKTTGCGPVNLCSISGFRCCPGEEAYCCPEETICGSTHGHCTLETKEIVFGISLQDSLNIFDVTRDISEGRGLDDDVTGGRSFDDDVIGGRSLINVNSGDDLVKDIKCPDKTQSCPNDATCCKMATGSYGCCPMPKATCCPDQLHCCPNGYICGGGGCEKKPILHLFQHPDTVQLIPIA